MSEKAPKRKRSAWFAFYPDDFDGGTRSMSLAGRGAFLGLLSYQFANGSVPSDDRTICRIIGAFPDEWDPIRKEVLAKFERDENGNLFNVRMQKEREEREGIRSRRVAAINKRWNKPDTNVSDLNEQTEYKDPDSVDTTTTTTTTTTTVLSTSELLPENENQMEKPARLSSETYDVPPSTVLPEEGRQAGSPEFSEKDSKAPMTEAAWLTLAGKMSIDTAFAVALYAEMDAKDWIDNDGKPVAFLAQFLRASWQREQARRDRFAMKPTNGKREEWMIEADIKRAKAEIARIQSDKANFNHGGHGPSLDDHKAKFEDAWLAELRALREEVRRQLPAEYAAFEREHAEHVAGMLKDGVPASTMDDDYALSRLAERMPEELPSFERWDREWNRENAWKDPEKLTAEARQMVKQLRGHLGKLEAELQGAIVAA